MIWCNATLLLTLDLLLFYGARALLGGFFFKDKDLWRISKLETDFVHLWEQPIYGLRWESSPVNFYDVFFVKFIGRHARFPSKYGYFLLYQTKEYVSKMAPAELIRRIIFLLMDGFIDGVIYYSRINEFWRNFVNLDQFLAFLSMQAMSVLGPNKMLYLFYVHRETMRIIL